MTNQDEILELVRNHPNLTRTELARLHYPDFDAMSHDESINARQKVAEKLRLLHKWGMVEPDGTKRPRRWRVKE